MTTSNNDNIYLHYCSNCGTINKQRFEGYVCDGLDEFHRKMFPSYNSAYSMTCFKCKSTRTYGAAYQTHASLPTHTKPCI